MLGICIVEQGVSGLSRCGGLNEPKVELIQRYIAFESACDSRHGLKSVNDRRRIYCPGRERIHPSVGTDVEYDTTSWNQTCPQTKGSSLVAVAIPCPEQVILNLKPVAP